MIPNDRVIAKLAMRLLGVVGSVAFPNQPNIIDAILREMTSDPEVRKAFYDVMQEGIDEWKAELAGEATSLFKPQPPATGLEWE